MKQEVGYKKLSKLLSLRALWTIFNTDPIDITENEDGTFNISGCIEEENLTAKELDQLLGQDWFTEWEWYTVDDITIPKPDNAAEIVAAINQYINTHMEVDLNHLEEFWLKAWTEGLDGIPTPIYHGTPCPPIN